MLTHAVLIAAALVAGEPTHHAAHSTAGSEAKALEHEQKQWEQAMRRQLQAEQQMVKAQERSVHEQMKAQLQAQALARTQHPEGSPFPINRSHASGYAGRPYVATTPSYRGGYHPSYYHHRTQRYQHQRTWPMAQDPELAGLHALKQSLDNVRHPQTSSPTQHQAIERALMRVVEVSRPPSITAIDRLAGHLATALATRESPTIDTSTMALSLRAGLNYPYLVTAERAEVQHELQTAMQHGKVRPNEQTLVMEALKAVEHQEQTRR